MRGLHFVDDDDDDDDDADDDDGDADTIFDTILDKTSPLRYELRRHAMLLNRINNQNI